MNKKVLAGILIFIFSAVTVAFAFEIATNVSENTNPIISSENVDEIDFEKVVSSNSSNQKDVNSFASIVNCDNEAKRNNISSYISFMASHSFTDNQISVINNVLDGGTTVQSLEQVYEFWLTTDEPFSIIQDICELESKYLNLYWYEDAFNEITENSHGVMELKDIKEYNQKGITNDVIMCANVLSRKKGQNIYNILDSVAEGKTIEKIACDIYKISELPEADTLYEKIILVNRAKGYGIDIKTKKLETVVQNVKAEIDSVADKSIKAATSDIKVQEYDENELFEQIENGNMHPKQIQILYNKGYTTKEIHLVSQMENEDYLSCAKKVRGGLKNE